MAGFVGVILFYVISGFLLYRPFVAARARAARLPRAASYARRRVLRIVPGFWAVLTMLAIFPGVAGVFTGDWWRYYGYLQLYSQKTQTLGIPVAWSLCVEVSFYLALPLWALAARRLPSRPGVHGLVRVELLPLAVIALGGVVVQLAASRQLVGHLVGASLAGACTWFAIGMALAVVSAAAHEDGSLAPLFRRLGARSDLCWGIAALAFLALLPLQPKGGLFGLIAAVRAPQSGWVALGTIVLEGIFVTCLVLPAIFGDGRQGLPRRLLASAPMAFLGVVSYSFYLWHLTVAEFIAWRSSPGAFSATGLNLLGHVHTARTLVLYVVTLAATGLLATASYRLIELPFLRRKESAPVRG